MGKLYLPVPVNPPSALPATVDALAPVSSSEARYGDHQSNLLLRQLREFVAEVLQVVDTLSAPLPTTAGDEAGEQAHKMAQEASERIARIIGTKTLDLSQQESTAARVATDEVRYLMAAMADELLLSRDWPGRTRFTETLIETRLFGSSVAGDQIFQRIDVLLAGSGDVPPPMATLYLFAISTGFEGRHRGLKADEALQPLRDALFRLIYRRDARLGSSLAGQPDLSERVLSPQAYRYPLSNIVPVRFFRLKLGTLSFIGTMLLLLALSQVAWRWSTAPVRKALEPSAPSQMKHPAPSESERG